MGALDRPVRTQEFEASFMYAAGHASAMAITRAFVQTPGSLMQVMAWRPSALPGHSKVNPGAAYASR
jgi:hypothetical protein